MRRFSLTSANRKQLLILVAEPTDRVRKTSPFNCCSNRPSVAKAEFPNTTSRDSVGFLSAAFAGELVGEGFGDAEGVGLDLSEFDSDGAST